MTANALAGQERALSGLRARAGIVLATASIAGSFLGAKISRGYLDAWGILAMISFVVAVGSAICDLVPHKFVFALRGYELLALSDHRALHDVTQAYRAAGIWIGLYLETNRDKIDELSDWLTLSCVLLAAKVILWTLSLGG